MQPLPRNIFHQITRTCAKLLHHQQQPLLTYNQHPPHMPPVKLITTTTNAWRQLLDRSAAATCEQARLLPAANPPPTVLQQQRWRNSFLPKFLSATAISADVPTRNSVPSIRMLLAPIATTHGVWQQQRPYSKFTAGRDPTAFYSGEPLSDDGARDLIYNLKDTERQAIKTALAKYDATQQKACYEGTLAATHWRTRFGRLSKVPALGDVDPTGTFCAFPDDWLKKKAEGLTAEPSRQDLLKILFVNMVPFFVFGFLDNFTMIIAGDYIEYVCGTFMCISTMAAAGLGNTISDVLGIGSAIYVERGCQFLGLKSPDLKPIQMEMKSTRRAANYGRIIGITIGCLVGMSPLLFKKAQVEEDPPEVKTTASKQ